MDFILGTAGHIDHGKTSLIQALTGVNTDRLPEEQKRGITIELGFAHLDLPPHRFGIVDVPGHERFIRNMLAGATGMDLVLLVVAADDSVKQQTREHLDILRMLNLRSGVIALTKTDLVAPDWIDLVEDEVRSLVAGTFLAEAPIVRTSSRTGDGIEPLRSRLFERAEEIAAGRSLETISKPCRIPIDREFTMEGHGTVVTGSVARGVLCVGDELEIQPGAIPVRVRSLQNHDQAVDQVHKGQRAAVNLAGVHHTEIARGQELATTGFLKPSRLVTGRLTLLDSAPAPLKNRSRLRFHIGTAEILANVRLIAKDILHPGETCFAQFFLQEKSVSTWNQPFVIRRESPMTTIGGGQIVDPVAEKIGPPNDDTLMMLEELRSENSSQRAAAAAYFHGFQTWHREDLIRDAGVEQIDKVYAELVEREELIEIEISRASKACVHTRRLEEVSLRVLATLRKLHDEHPLKTNFSIDELGNRFAYLPTGVFAALLQRLKQMGKVTVGPRGVAAVGSGPKLSQNEKRLLDEIVQWFLSSGLTPPTVGQCQERATRNRVAVPQLITLAVANGDLVEIADGLFFHSTVEKQIRETLNVALVGSTGATLGEIRDALGTTRKFAVPLCEYLDEIGFTKRDGDLRVLSEAPNL